MRNIRGSGLGGPQGGNCPGHRAGPLSALRPWPIFPLLALLWFCSGPAEERPAAQGQLSNRPDQEAWGWKSVVTKSGVPRAVVRAGRFRHYRSSRVDSLDQGVEIEFFDPGGERVSVLRSGLGAVAEGSRNMAALGGVVVLASDSTTLTTESLRWENQADRIFGDGWVKIKKRDGEETGVGFESTTDLRRWSMKNVTTRGR